MSANDVLIVINWVLAHYDVVIVTTIVGWVFKYGRQFIPVALDWLQHKLGERRYALACKVADQVVRAVEQIASNPDVRNIGQLKFEMANKRVDDFLKSKGIDYTAEQIEVLIENAVKQMNEDKLYLPVSDGKKPPVVPPMPFPAPAPTVAGAIGADASETGI